MQRKSAKLLNELNRMKVLGGIIKENYNSDDNVDDDNVDDDNLDDDNLDDNDIDWGDVAIERRKEIVGKIENEFGSQNQYSGSADWGGIPVWSVLGSEFEGYFIIDDSEFFGPPNTAFSLMKRTFNPDTEENTDEILFTAFVTPERFGEQGNGTMDELLQMAREIKTQSLNDQDLDNQDLNELIFRKPITTNIFRDKRKKEEDKAKEEKDKAARAKAEAERAKAKELKSEDTNLNENIEINAKLSSKQGIKNAIYKILEMNKVEDSYVDEDQEGVDKFVNALTKVGAEVDLIRSHSEGRCEVPGYQSSPAKKVYLYEISVRDKKGIMITIPFQVTCDFGKSEDNALEYKLTYYTMA